MKLSQTELSEFREILRVSLGSEVDHLSGKQLHELATLLLDVTSMAIKARHSAYDLKNNKY